ncbi:MAG: VCBS repeat-containing protein [Nitrospirae bacterium]|nr:VCBS repeat-containing protein [Nitrospirota bacterium]
MKKNCIAFIVLIVFSCFCTPASEAAPQNTEADNPVKSLKETVLAYFSPVSGVVTDVADGVVRIRLDGEVSVNKGMRFSVFRKGRPFYHPITNELIADMEDFTGTVEVKDEKQGEGLYACSIVQGDVKAGDTIRISTSKVKLAFFQDKKSDWKLSEDFYSAIKDSGRFEILESYAPSSSTEDLVKLAKGLGAEVMLLFSTSFKDEKKFITTRLYWTEDAKMFADIEEAAGGAVNMLAPAEEFLTSSLSNKEPWGSYKLAGGQLIAAGDVDNNGITELVVSDGKNISIYNLKEDLQELWSISGNIPERHLSIDVMDINNNGKAEIFVTSMIEGSAIKTNDVRVKDDMRIKSFVLEYDPSSGYKRIKDDIPYFLRVSGRTLLMQKFTPGRIFDGAVYEAEWKDGDYQPKRPLDLPAGINVYGFTYIDWQEKGQKQIMTFDDKGYLMMYDYNGHLMWQSDKSCGAPYLTFESETGSIANPTKKWAVRGRLISVKTGRGQEIITVDRVPVAPNVPGLGTGGGEARSFWWNGSAMEEKVLLSELSGTATDYWIEGKKLFIVAKGNLMTFVRNAVTGELSKGSILYYYHLGETSQ